ncbi:hypothetical protein ACQ4PT_025747 [Festuca glaucescens]
MAASREEGEGSGKTGHLGAVPSLEELLRSLNLTGADIAGISVAKEKVDALKEGTKWVAVMRLLLTKSFSVASLKKTMEFAWAPAQEVTFRDLAEDNRFIVQANCLGDWQRITEQGPWIFRDQGLLIEKYDGSCKASSVPLNRIHAWVQIHDIPELFRKRQIMTELVAIIGEVLTVDMNGGMFVRARVWLDVRKELTRFVTIRPEGSSPVVMRVKYEKIPRYYSICGHLGHIKEECGMGEHSLEKEGFGKWLLADTIWNRTQLSGGEQARPHRRDQAAPGTGRGAGQSGRGGTGRGGGRDGGHGGRGVGRGGRGGDRALESHENRWQLDVLLGGLPHLGEPARELPTQAIDGAIAAPGERMPQPDLERASMPGEAGQGLAGAGEAGLAWPQPERWPSWPGGARLGAGKPEWAARSRSRPSRGEAGAGRT